VDKVIIKLPFRLTPASSVSTHSIRTLQPENCSDIEHAQAQALPLNHRNKNTLKIDSILLPVLLRVLNKFSQSSLKRRATSACRKQDTVFDPRHHLIIMVRISNSQSSSIKSRRENRQASFIILQRYQDAMSRSITC
jgi:hypothetical protein